ncbi:MAG TPA: lysylphosphatidylglycerol synthase transmembrane domain-containing protein [Candidatus Limnocylindrales bacterium]|nr:lysylphosphatidylglycerol synthase transmembrane domain-containing protein [Candidatus Limnocylindrales bacterium]
MRRGPILRALVGGAISIVALWFVLRGVDLARTGDLLRSADLRWVAFAAALLTLDLSFRALRWQRLLRPIASVRYPPMLGYLLIGYLANNVLPARLGELVRVHYLGDREGISRASALGTVVVERVVDLVAVVAIASVSLLILSVRGVVASAVLVGAAVAGLFLVILAIGIVAHRIPGAERIAAIVDRWPRIRQLARSLQGGLAVASRPRTLAEALLASAASWTVAILSFAAVGQAIGVELTIGQAALIASGVALASAVPAGPSNLGTFEFAAVEIGKAIGVPADSAFAMALLVHATILVVTSVGGGIAFARLGWRGERAATGAEPAP